MHTFSTSIYCPHCHKYTALSTAVTEYRGERGQTEQTAAVWENKRGDEWWIAVCNSCNEPSLVLNNGERVFPDPLPKPTDPSIPKDLAKDLDESKQCFSSGCFRACAVMARRCIQTACLLKGAKKSNLVDQIAELAASNIITKDIEEWANVVRWVGNDAAHPGKGEVKSKDAEDCLHLAEQFLHVIFVTPAIARARRMATGK